MKTCNSSLARSRAKTIAGAMCILAMVFASPAAAKKKSKQPAEVLILGSSSINGGIGFLLQRELRDRGYRTKRFARSSSGFARPDFFDWLKAVPKLPDLENIQAAIVYAGVNDGQSVWLHKGEREGKGKKAKWIYFKHEDRWSQLYESRVNAFVKALCDAGVQRVIVLSPNDVVPKKAQGRMVRVRALQESATSKTACGVAISTAGDAELFKTKRSSRKRLRSSDGFHATKKGAQAIWSRIGQQLIDALPPPASPAPAAE